MQIMEESVLGLFGPKTFFFPDVKKIVRVGPFFTGKVG